MDKLSNNDLNTRLESLPGWSVDKQALTKTFVFKDFETAMTFINRLAKAASQLNHHPDWTNSYKQVDVRLSTHQAGGITAQDFELARRAEQAAADLPVSMR